MARRGSRKVTTGLVNDSLALLRIVSEAVDVLQRWHPSLISLAIIAQQIPAVQRELLNLAPTVAAEDPVELFRENV